MLMDKKQRWRKKGERITKAICNKGFSGSSNILLRSNFSVGGQDSSPQSLTAYSLSRYRQV
jgi:GH15 family glucan-1,4-alpha-glucosidase